MNIKVFSTDERGAHYERKVFKNSESGWGIITVRITDEVVHMNFGGFGVAVTGSSCYDLHQMRDEERSRFLEQIYGKDGLGLTVARVSIGSSDYSPELYCLEDKNGNFSIERDREYVLPVLKEIAEKYPQVKFFASPWSPPPRMKTGGYLMGGFMRERFLDEYADYILKFIDAYEKEGIKISAVTPQNEPESDQLGRSPTCLWSPETEANFAVILKKKALAAGKNFEIWLLDHNFSMYERIIWQYENFPELLKSADAAAFHYYAGGADCVEKIREKFPSVKFHFTEGGSRLNYNYSTDHVKWAASIADALEHGCKTYTGWNLLLDEHGGPNVGPFDCGGLVTKNMQSGEYSFSGQYRAFEHFSKAVKVGASVLRCEVSGENRGFYDYPEMTKLIKAFAVKNENGEVVLIVINPDKKSRRQIFITYADEKIYLEVAPDSVNTIIMV